MPTNKHVFIDDFDQTTYRSFNERGANSVEGDLLPRSDECELRLERTEPKLDAEDARDLRGQVAQQLRVVRSLTVPDLAGPTLARGVDIGPERGDDAAVVVQRETVGSVLGDVPDKRDYPISVDLWKRKEELW